MKKAERGIEKNKEEKEKRKRCVHCTPKSDTVVGREKTRGAVAKYVRRGLLHGERERGRERERDRDREGA
jgi:hypothetical protein